MLGSFFVVLTGDRKFNVFLQHGMGPSNPPHISEKIKQNFQIISVIFENFHLWILKFASFFMSQNLIHR